MHYLYILELSNSALYTGITTDITRRISEHNSGKGSAYVRSHRPAKLVYKERHKTKSRALKREAEIKSWTRTKKLALIKGNLTELSRLSVSGD